MSNRLTTISRIKKHQRASVGRGWKSRYIWASLPTQLSENFKLQLHIQNFKTITECSNLHTKTVYALMFRLPAHQIPKNSSPVLWTPLKCIYCWTSTCCPWMANCTLVFTHIRGLTKFLLTCNRFYAKFDRISGDGFNGTWLPAFPSELTWPHSAWVRRLDFMEVFLWRQFATGQKCEQLSTGPREFLAKSFTSAVAPPSSVSTFANKFGHCFWDIKSESLSTVYHSTNNTS